MTPSLRRGAACASAALAAFVLAAGADGCAAEAGPADLVRLFPQAAAPPRAERPLALRLGHGGTLRLTPVRLEARPGADGPYRQPKLCGVVLETRGAPAQALVTLGVGVTETVGCSGLAAAGAAPPGRDGGLRIALVYDTFTPRGALRTPVVLRRDPAGGRWAVDEAQTERMDAEARPARTVAEIRRKLAGR